MKLDASLEERLKVTKFSEDGKLFLRAFLLDATKNVNGWRVRADSIPQKIKSFIGAPFVFYVNRGNEPDKESRTVGESDHPPYLLEKDVRGNAEYQARFSIGKITDVVEKGGQYDAIIEVTHPAAKDAIEKNDIPLKVSPRILYDTNEPLDDIRTWAGFHLAAVGKPAYGDKAAVTAACYGENEECKLAIASASIPNDCGFCVKTELLKLVTNHDSSHSSLNLDGKKNLLMENKAPISEVPQVDLSGYVPKADYEKLVAEVSAKNAAFEQAKKAYDERLAAIELENTTNKITAVLSAKIADKEELAKKVKYFVDAKVAPEVVSEAFKLVPDVTAPKADNESTFTGKPADAKANGGWMDNFYKVQSQVIKGVRA